MPLNINKISRRKFMQNLAVGSSALYLNGLLSACNSKTSLSPVFSDEEIDVELQLAAVNDKVQIFDGKKTNVWRYVGEVLKGSDDALATVHGSYLGPVLTFKTGQNIRVHFRNEIGEPSIIHWHGLHVPESADGHPRLVIANGEEYVYDFKVMDRAGTYWFHPHPHGRTGPQVYKGLAGLIIIHDEEEEVLGLPSGAYDLPLVIQDRSFDAENQFLYSFSHMNQVMGFLGDTLLINGLPENEFSVENRPYRLRLLNGSNSRIYKLGWSDGKPLTVIATDGGLLEKPIKQQYVTLAPAQRLEIWADFSNYELGSNVQLVNLSNDTPGGRDEYDILRFSIDDQASNTIKLPERLTTIDYHRPVDAVNNADPRDFALQVGMGMIWNINGRTFEMEEVANEEKVRLGDLEIWQFTNAGGVGMVLPHPMHIHGLQFQIIERTVDSDFKDIWDTVSDGYIDEGWHDTVLVMPGEQVRVLLKFEDFEGLYLYHCHNLEHEDMGMMRNYLVSA